MSYAQMLETLTTATTAVVDPILTAVAHAVHATRAEVDRLTQVIAAARDQRAGLITAKATETERMTALRDARTALLAAELAGEVIDPVQLATSTTDLLTATLALDDAATRVRLSDDKLRALEAERDAASRTARRGEIDALSTEIDRSAADVDAALAVALERASVYVVLEASRTRLVTQDGGRGTRDPRGRVEAAVAFAFRPIFYAGHVAAPRTGHVHPTPAADALEWERQRQASEPAPLPEPPVAVASDGWTRRG